MLSFVDFSVSVYSMWPRFRPLSVSRYFLSKNEFQWETTLSKHSSMSLLSLSRVAAFKLSSKAEVLSLREGKQISFLKTALFTAPQITSFHLKLHFICLHRSKESLFGQESVEGISLLSN